MIPFLLQRRLAGGGTPPPTVTNPPDWSGLTFGTTEYALNGTVSAESTFTLYPDGSWAASNDAGTLGGYWINPHASGVGSGYKAQFTVTASLGTGTVTNGASVVVSLSSVRSFVIAVTTSVSGVRTCQRTVRVDIYDSSDNLLSTGSFTQYASVENGS